MPEMTKKPITMPEDHGNSKLPSWRAAMMNEHAVRMRNAPKRSIFQRKVLVLGHVRSDVDSSADAWEWCGKWAGMAQDIKAKATPPAGTLH
jgi:hypothetical protein